MQNEPTSVPRKYNGILRSGLPHPNPALAAYGCTLTFTERFWSKVDKNGPVPPHRPELGPCWVWMGAKASYGYGAVHLGHGSVRGRAHVASWLMHFGPVPEGQQVLHKCDNPPCINPFHLFTGTPLDNSRDKMEKGRYNHGIPACGENHKMSKLNDVKVREIRTLYAAGGKSFNQLARLFDVSKKLILLVVHRKIWKHVS